MQKNIPQLKLKYVKGKVISESITRPEHAATVIRKFFDEDTIEYNEEGVALFLDTASQPIGWIRFAVGGQTNCLFDVRMLFATALTAGATKLMIAHNHPSGNCKPSASDISVTRKFQEASNFLDIHFVDHFIITKTDHYSMIENGDI